MHDTLITVGGCIPTAADSTNLREEVWSFALDQRAFGPRQLVVAFADSTGRFLGLSYAPRTAPAELGLAPCIQYLDLGPCVAVAFCDEPVVEGPPPPELSLRFTLARSIAAGHGVHLVDWIACDDQLFRSTRLALQPDRDWWDVP